MTSTINRIVGQNSGIDVDTVVKQSLSNEQNKIDKAYQQQKVYEYTQEQLKKVVSDTEDFYDKYLDILSSDSLRSNSAYKSVSFTSKDSSGAASTAVTAKGYAGADVANYKVAVSQIASKAQKTLNESYFSDIINAGGGVLAVTMKDSEGKDVTAYVDAVFSNGELDMKATASALTTQLNKSGIKVTAKYSELSKGITLSSVKSGENVTFGIASKGNISTLENTEKNKEDFEKEFSYEYLEGKNAKAVITRGIGENAVTYQVDESSNVITIDNVEFTFNNVTNSSPVSDEEIQEICSRHLSDSPNVGKITYEDATGKTTVVKKNSIVTTQSYSDGTEFRASSVVFQVSEDDINQIVNGNLKHLDLPDGQDKISQGNITTKRLEDGSKETTLVQSGIRIKTITDKDNKTTTTVNVNGRTIDFTDKLPQKGSESGTSNNDFLIRISEDNSIGIRSTIVSAELSTLSKDSKDVTVSEVDGGTRIYRESDKKETIVSADGNVTTTTKEYDNGIKVQTVVTKSLDKDGKTVTDTKTSIVSGELKDLTSDFENIKGLKETVEYDEGKEKIVTFVDEDSNEKKIATTIITVANDDGTFTNIEQSGETEFDENGYIRFKDGVEVNANKFETISLEGQTDISDLKEKIIKFVDDYNTLISSINEKLWEERDKDYMPLTDDQKSEMTDSQIEAWEKKAKTGLLRSDSDLQRIQNELKNAMGTVMSGTGLRLEDIGIKPVKNYTTKNGMYEVDESTLTKALQDNAEGVKDLFTRTASDDDKGGILTQLNKSLYSEVKNSNSILSQRIGFEGTSTETKNTLTENISKQKKLIKELKKKYSTKETALYKKYSNLEVMLEKLNSQSNSLYTMLGIS